jgi:hypothetical protein
MGNTLEASDFWSVLAAERKRPARGDERGVGAGFLTHHRGLHPAQRLTGSP